MQQTPKATSESRFFHKTVPQHTQTVHALVNPVHMTAHSKAEVYAIARNMGTTVQMIEAYYGKHATSAVMTTRLGG